MKLIAVAVYDSQAKAFNRPYFVQAPGIAIRGFMDEVNRAAQDNILYQHPDDFTLQQLGFWDEERGLFENTESQPVLMRGRDAKKDPAN